MLSHSAALIATDGSARCTLYDLGSKPSASTFSMFPENEASPIFSSIPFTSTAERISAGNITLPETGLPDSSYVLTTIPSPF